MMSIQKLGETRRAFPNCMVLELFWTASALSSMVCAQKRMTTVQPMKRWMPSNQLCMTTRRWGWAKMSIEISMKRIP